MNFFSLKAILLAAMTFMAAPVFAQTTTEIDVSELKLEQIEKGRYTLDKPVDNMILTLLIRDGEIYRFRVKDAETGRRLRLRRAVAGQSGCNAPNCQHNQNISCCRIGDTCICGCGAFILVSRNN